MQLCNKNVYKMFLLFSVERKGLNQFSHNISFTTEYRATYMYVSSSIIYGLIYIPTTIFNEAL